MKDFDALILCGGQGSRLRSIIDDKPKVLAPVNGRPFLSYLLDQLITSGFREFVLRSGYKGYMVREAFGNDYKNMSIRYSQEPEPYGTGGALRYALPIIEGSFILVMNGDSYIDANLSDFIRFYFKENHHAVILLAKTEYTSRYGRVEIDEDEKIIRFDEKKEGAGPGWINAGIYFLKTSLLGHIPSGRHYSLEHDFFPCLPDGSLYGYRCKSKLLDIGTPASYAKA